MTIRPTRSLTAGVIAAGIALSATIAVAAPTAQARSKTPSAHDVLCDALYDDFSHNVDAGLAKSHAGKDFSAELTAARNDLNGARAEGCEWAARTVLPKGGTRLTPSIPIPPPAI